MRILVTGFEPFGDDDENASIIAVDLLAERWRHDDVRLLTGRLPVVFGAAGAALRELVGRWLPDAVVAVGEAGGRSAVTPERQGVNDMTARIPDNAGQQPSGQPIFDDGPGARVATLDVDALAAAISAAGVASEVSDDAGRFVCNSVAYLLPGLGVPAAFVHVPAVRTEGVATVGAETDESADPATALTFDELALALEAAVLDAARQLR